MKNKKILRAIAALTVGAVAAAGCVSLTACGHKHTWSDDYTADGASGHYQICTGCDEHSDTEPHNLVNGECTICHWKSPSTGGGDEQDPPPSGGDDEDDNNPGGGDEGDDDEQNPPAGLSYNVVKIADLGNNGDSLSSGVISADLGIELVGGKLSSAVVSENAEAVAYTSSFNGEALSLTKYVSTQGSINGSNSLKITTTEKTTVYVYAYSSGSPERFLALYDETSSNSAYAANTNQSIGDGSGTVLGVAKFELEANVTKYIGSTGSTIYIYAVGLVTGGDANETTAETVNANASDCKTEGNIAYTITNYGRYLNSEGKAIGPHSIVDPIKPHTYTYDQAALDADKPTETEGKAVTVTCSVCQDVQTVQLPNLKSAAYVTETKQDGSVDYSYTDSCGAVITFNATAASKDGVEGTYTYSPNVDTGLSGTASNDANVTADSLITLTGVTNNASYIQFGSSSSTVELKIFAEAGTTIKLDFTYVANSSSNTAGFVVSAEGATKSAGDESFETVGNASDATASVTYTVDAEGTVTISFKRGGPSNSTSGTRLKGLVVTVTKAG